MPGDLAIPEPLTPRELDILHLLAEGLTNAEIAGRLVLTAGTVKWYVKQLYGKLDVHTRKELVTRARSLGLVSSAPVLHSPERRDVSGCRLINPLPLDLSGRYVGNADKLTLLADLLKGPTRLVSIYGRGGVGKTALACKALADLYEVALSRHTLEGIVCLSAASTGLDTDRVFTDLGRLLAEPDQQAFEALARNNELLSGHKASLLFEKLAGKRIVLLLDNLETVQDQDTGALLDRGLQQFLEMSLAQSSALTLLVTSRVPLLLPRALKPWEYPVLLGTGLPPADAETLLRRLDPAGHAGLRDAPAAELQELAAQVGGFPRALEATAGLLLEDPLLTLADVRRDHATLTGEICAAVVAQALDRLSDDAMRVLQVLALFDQPVPYVALRSVLEPYLPEPTLHAMLGRLLRAGFVKADQARQHFALHPLDQAYCYSRIPAGSPDDVRTEPPPFTRAVLHQHAAAYYRARRLPRTSWRRLADLAPQRSEFHHLLSAGATDAAAQVLLEIDREFLWEREYKELLGQLYDALGDHVRDPRLAHHVARRRAWLVFFDPSQEAEREFARLLDEARQMGFAQEEADALDDLAQTYRRGGRDLAQAVDYHRQALGIYRRLGNRRGEADALGGLGSALVPGEPHQAILYLQEAAAIHRELGNLSGVSYTLSMVGSAYEMLGDPKRALAPLEEAVRLASESGSVDALGRACGGVASCYITLGDNDRGIASIDEAMALTRELAGVPVTGSLFFQVCLAATSLVLAGAPQAGEELLRRAIRETTTLLPKTVPLGNLYLSLILLLKGDIHGARRLLPAQPEVLVTKMPASIYWVSVLLIKAGEQAAATQCLNMLLEVGRQRGATPNFWYSGATTPQALALAHAGLALLLKDTAQVERAAELIGMAAQARSRQTDILNALIGLLIEEPNGGLLLPLRKLLLANPSHGTGETRCT